MSAIPLPDVFCNGDEMEALDCLGEACECISFIDDDSAKQGPDRYGTPSALHDFPSVVHHRSTVSDWCLIGSTVTITGHSKIGETCYIGNGASIIKNARIGRGTLVGLGTTVVSAIRASATVAGNPARVIN